MNVRELFGAALVVLGESIIRRAHRPRYRPEFAKPYPGHHALCNVNLFVDGVCDCDARLPEPVRADL